MSSNPEAGRVITYAEALYEATVQEMEREAGVFVYGLGVDDRFLVDRVGWGRLCGIGLHPEGPPTLVQLDQFDRRRRDIEPDEDLIHLAPKHYFSFPTPQVGVDFSYSVKQRSLTIYQATDT